MRTRDKDQLNRELKWTEEALDNARRETRYFFILNTEDVARAMMYGDYHTERNEEDFMEYLVENFIYDNVDEKISYYIDRDKLGADLYLDYSLYTPKEVVEALEEELDQIKYELEELAQEAQEEEDRLKELIQTEPEESTDRY